MKRILIPCAGMGSRVKDHYKTIKPLIDVNGKSLIQWVIHNTWDKDSEYIFIVQREHCKDFSLDEHLQETCNSLGNKCSIIQLDGLTEGAAVSCLKASHIIDDENPCLVANSDQYCLNFSTHCLFKQMEIDEADCGVIVFNDDNPKWSFLKTNRFGNVCRAVEKTPISNLATLGYYAFKQGSDFVRLAREMISDNFRVNGEFYVCPVIDYLCKNGAIVKAYYSDKSYGTGTIIDIENFREISKAWN